MVREMEQYSIQCQNGNQTKRKPIHGIKYMLQKKTRILEIFCQTSSKQIQILWKALDTLETNFIGFKSNTSDMLSV